MKYKTVKSEIILYIVEKDDWRIKDKGINKPDQQDKIQCS